MPHAEISAYFRQGLRLEDFPPLDLALRFAHPGPCLFFRFTLLESALRTRSGPRGQLFCPLFLPLLRESPFLNRLFQCEQGVGTAFKRRALFANLMRPFTPDSKPFLFLVEGFVLVVFLRQDASVTLYNRTAPTSSSSFFCFPFYYSVISFTPLSECFLRP